MESARLIAGLARVTGDLGLAEELAQDALVTALEQWPSGGIPANPAGWLMTTAKRSAIDAHRRRVVYQRKLESIGRAQPAGHDPFADEVDAALDDHFGDDLLRLIFTAAHPSLSTESRVALTLRCLCGMSTEEIGRAYLVPTTTAAARIVRAKRALSAQFVAFELPEKESMADRLASVLEVIYLIFNEGYSASSGDNWMRPALAEEALRLGRVLAGLVPDEPEVHGLVALMEIQASRTPARTGPDGEPVLLPDQDRRRWDRLLIRRGLAALDRAESLAKPIGPYTLQAEIAACHARADRMQNTDWSRIAALYLVLGHIWPSPVVELNRAVAVGMADGPAAGLAVLDAAQLRGDLRDYPLQYAVRGDLLARLGHSQDAVEQFRSAAALTRNAGERAVFARRADELSTAAPEISAVRHSAPLTDDRIRH